jgi:hypothetical protein
LLVAQAAAAENKITAQVVEEAVAVQVDTKQVHLLCLLVLIIL